MEFETLDSKMAKGVMKIIPAEFKRKINFLEETIYNNAFVMLTGWLIMQQIFSFFNINKTQGTLLTLHQQDIVLKKGAEKLPEIEDHG